MSEILTRDNERVVSFFRSIDRMLDDVEKLVENSKPALVGERYLSDKELSEHLRISRRTLQDYRDQGRIPFYQLGGKILYKESDIQRVLDDGYRDAFRTSG